MRSRSRLSIPMLLGCVVWTAACEDTVTPVAPEPVEPVAAMQILPGDPVTVIEQLPTLPDWPVGSAHAINTHRQVVGWLGDGGANASRAFIWSPGGGMQLIPSWGGMWNEALDINDQGVAVGFARYGNDTHGFRWSPSIGIQSLGIPHGYLSAAFAINESDYVVGTGSDNGDGYAAEAPPGGLFAASALGPDLEITDINEQGWRVGRRDLPFVHEAWVSYDGLVAHPLPGVTNSFGTGAISGKIKINNYGMAVGTGQVPTAQHSGDHRGLVWPAFDSNPVPVVIPTLGGIWSRALDVNDAGVVVGLAADASKAARPFRWSSSTGIRDLGTPEPRGAAVGINTRGDIVGWTGIGSGAPIPTLWWRYQKPTSCLCEPPMIQAQAVIVSMMSSKSFRVRDVAMHTVTLGVPEKPSTRINVAGSPERPMVEYQDLNRDGVDDAVLYFDLAELKEMGVDQVLEKGVFISGASVERTWGFGQVLKPARYSKRK